MGRICRVSLDWPGLHGIDSLRNVVLMALHAHTCVRKDSSSVVLVSVAGDTSDQLRMLEDGNETQSQ
jgi:hypothetical protein